MVKGLGAFLYLSIYVLPPFFSYMYIYNPSNPSPPFTLETGKEKKAMIECMISFAAGALFGVMVMALMAAGREEP